MKNKIKNLILTNKKFLITYSIIIPLIFLALILLSILGNIERTGYLSDFKKIFDNYYSCKMNYYNNKVFRHSDIFGVYPYFNYDTDYIFNSKDDKGTPFSTLVSYDDLKYDDKVDIQYKLKLKKNIIIIAIIILLFFPFIYLYIVPNIIKNYKYYICFFIINTSIYLLIPIILKKFSIITIKYHYADILLSYAFLMIAFNLLNKKILFTILFEIINIFSFFIIQPLGLTFQNRILLFSDMPTLYPSLITLLPKNIKTITILATILYFSIILLIIILFILNLKNIKRRTSIIMSIYIIIFTYLIFFRESEVNIAWNDFLGQANKNGIIDTINYTINYNRLNNKTYSKEDVSKALAILVNRENKRNYDYLQIDANNTNRDIFLIFLESFYDYSHFVKLFNKDPFPKEYRKWANASQKIPPNAGSGSFYARITGLTASIPLYYQKQTSNNIEYTLTDLLKKNGYYTIALEEAGNSYNLINFLPAIGFQDIVFDIGMGKLHSYLKTNINNFKKPLFVYGFTLLGHTETYMENDFNTKENNSNFFNFIQKEDVYNLVETINNSVTASIEVLKIKDTILKYSPNALIIFKHDHLYPYLRAIIERSTIDKNIKKSFLEDNSPSPLLVWDGTNGAYKAPVNIVPENIPMFIAINAGITNYKNSVISLLYKEEIDNTISTYHKYYKITNNSLILENNADENSEIFKYENAQKILSQDIFQGKKYYYELINDLEESN
ncbi:hypothetical protein [Brachyspira pilosicoli]|uniref:hypothetical protein n=1 Tax=Brachyspira pilosicoli TaxID=52584 RepID=UPI003004EFDE